jgi:AcrR family transcriptional regulator
MSPRSAEPKRRLDPQTIVEAGLRIAARPGLEALSFRALGTELGVDPTAIYRHFRSKDELMCALLDELHRQVLAQLPTQSDWRQRIRDLAEHTLAAHIAHPAVSVESPVLTTGGPGEIATIEFILTALSDAGLSDAEVVRHYSLIAAFMLSQAATIAQARAVAASGDREASLPWLGRRLTIDIAEQPRMASLYRELTDIRDDDVYRLGIESVLDSAARTAAERVEA